MIRICHLITGLDVGGAEKNLANLLERMDRTRFGSRVISMIDAGPIGLEIQNSGIPVTSLKMKRGKIRLQNIRDAVANIKHEHCDILQTWMYHADLLGTLAGRLAKTSPIIWNLRCSDIRGAGRRGPLLALLATFSAYPRAVVVNSDAGRALHQRFGYRPRQWVTIPNGVDTEKFRPRPDSRQKLRERLGLGPKDKAIALVARLHPMKDHSNFIEASRLVAQRRADAVFFLIGEGCSPQSPALTFGGEADPFRNSYRMLGVRQDLELIYPALDVLVLSSAYGEGFPTVLIEALACGIPCVATDVGDSARIVGECGLIVPPRDPSRLADAIDAILNHDWETQSAAARARAVSLFGLDRMTSAYESLYERLAAEAA